MRSKLRGYKWLLDWSLKLQNNIFKIVEMKGRSLLNTNDVDADDGPSLWIPDHFYS